MGSSKPQMAMETTDEISNGHPWGWRVRRKMPVMSAATRNRNPNPNSQNVKIPSPRQIQPKSTARGLPADDEAVTCTRPNENKMSDGGREHSELGSRQLDGKAAQGSGD
jgi:hypothetical protein